MNGPLTPRQRFPEDPFLRPYRATIERRIQRARALDRRLTGGTRALADIALAHEHFGLHRHGDEWVFREWAPAATAVRLIGDFCDWRENEAVALRRLGNGGEWEARLPGDRLRHGQRYQLHVAWPGGSGERVPAFARRAVQDERTHLFCAQVWAPDRPYEWNHPAVPSNAAPLVYETHVGMAQERPGVGTFREFRERTLPRIAEAGYNTLQLMAILEHPYYGSFGYHVSSFFAVSSRFGDPEEFKALVDAAHGAGLAVVIDLVHSHAARNEAEGLSRFDGTLTQYFHDGPRGMHPAWDSRCFDYDKPEVLRFLLSNCRFWLDEYRVDGFRFDGVTSMLYHDHGLGRSFDSYDAYFGPGVDEDALAYLTLANRVIHAVRPGAMTIAEDVSGMPGLAAPFGEGGCGFDYRLAMGAPDYWFKLVADARDEDWSPSRLWHELTNRRGDERSIGYVESHDQALVGGKTLAFHLMDAAMYHAMRIEDQDLTVDRGMALHKMARLATLAAAGHGYLNFMGNEFGHPEWVDFPREGNGWSYDRARRQWNLRDAPDLKYRFLADFDRVMLEWATANGILTGIAPRLLLAREDDKTLAWERAGFLVLFNFHPDRSLTDYALDVQPGAYDAAFDTDEPRFGGHGRIAPRQRHFTCPAHEGNTLKHLLRVYLPSRSALVLRGPVA